VRRARGRGQESSGRGRGGASFARGTSGECAAARPAAGAAGCIAEHPRPPKHRVDAPFRPAVHPGHLCVPGQRRAGPLHVFPHRPLLSRRARPRGQPRGRGVARCRTSFGAASSQRHGGVPRGLGRLPAAHTGHVRAPRPRAPRAPRLPGSRRARQPPAPPPPFSPRTKWTRRVPHPVLIGHAASLTPY
jgi:hypothetical protein